MQSILKGGSGNIVGRGAPTRFDVDPAPAVPNDVCAPGNPR